jgi:hypothetical protein
MMILPLVPPSLLLPEVIPSPPPMIPCWRIKKKAISVLSVDNYLTAFYTVV